MSTRVGQRYHLAEVTSTQEIAKEHLKKRENCHGITIVAKKQTQGIGRLDRSWDSPEGGLWMSKIIQLPIPVKLFHGFSVRVGLSLAKRLDSMIDKFVQVFPESQVLEGEP